MTLTALDERMGRKLREMIYKGLVNWLAFFAIITAIYFLLFIQQRELDLKSYLSFDVWHAS